MVGGVKARTLKHNTDRRVNFSQGFFVAFGAASQRGIAKALLLFELHTTIFTSIGINWHSTQPHFFSNSIIAFPDGNSKSASGLLTKLLRCLRQGFGVAVAAVGFVGVAVFVGALVFVGTSVLVGRGVLVGTRVRVGVGVLVGTLVMVLVGVLVGGLSTAMRWRANVNHSAGPVFAGISSRAR